MQLNTQHAKQAQIEINSWVDRNKNSQFILMIQEPYIYKNKASMQPLTAQKHIGGNNKHPRTSIYTHPNLPV